MTSHHLRYWLAAIYLPGIGPRRMMRWLELFADIEALFLASKDELQAAGLTPGQIAAFKNPDWKSVDKDLAWAQKPHHHLITFAGDD